MWNQSVLSDFFKYLNNYTSCGLNLFSVPCASCINYVTPKSFESNPFHAFTKIGTLECTLQDLGYYWCTNDPPVGTQTLAIAKLKFSSMASCSIFKDTLSLNKVSFRSAYYKNISEERLRRGVYLCSEVSSVWQSERECVPERGEREILFVFLFCLYLAVFLCPTLKLCKQQRGWKKKRGRVREYSQFPSKKKIHLQLLM